MSKFSTLILDRDGVINIDKGYVHLIKDFDFFQDIFRIIRSANKMNYLVIIVTNQAGIGMGSAYLLGKKSKVKGAFQLDIAPRFRAVAESKSQINKITTHKSDKEFLKAIKTKRFKSAVVSKRKPKQ